MANKSKSMSAELLIETKLKNDQEMNQYFRMIEMMCLSKFKYSGLPDTIPEYFIERCLFYWGMCTFFVPNELYSMDNIFPAEDMKDFVIAGRTIPGTNLDIYGNFTNSSVWAVNGMHWDLDRTNSVVMYNSYLRAAGINDTLSGYGASGAAVNGNIGVPTVITAMEYARQLADIQRAMRVNLSSLSTPLIISGTQKNMLSLVNKCKQYQAGVPFISVEKESMEMHDPDMVCIDTHTPFYVGNFQDALSKKWNECMTALGINNANTDKRERLLTDEVQANNDQVNLVTKSMLESRKAAVEQVNRLFGTQISVDEVHSADVNIEVGKESSVPSQQEEYADNTDGSDSNG